MMKIQKPLLVCRPAREPSDEVSVSIRRFIPVASDIRLTQRWTYKYIKRTMDLFLSVIGLVMLFPLMLIIALVVKMTSPGPIFYRWEVIGREGKPFTGYKFRTMVINADDLKEELWEYNERKGPTFKMKIDPRVTPIGVFLRKFSFDELPQLWSVVKGDMSLVGPRPVGPDEWRQFKKWQRRKLSVVPGGVCIWHVRGKPPAFEEWVRLDLAYIDNWSVWLDIKILFGALRYVLSGRNY